MSRFNWIQKAWTEVIALWRRSKLWILHVFALAWARVRWIRIGWTKFVGRWRRGKRWVLRVLAFVWARVRQFAWLLVLATVLVIVWLTLRHWDWLSNVGNDLWGWLGSTPSGQDREETNSSTLRNVGLLIAGFFALLIAGWRSWVAGRQAKTAVQDLLNDRYQKGAEMLGNEVLSVRLGGIYALQHLAEEHPEQYHVQIMRLFCAFVRHPPKEVDRKSAADAKRDLSEETPSLREDVQAVMQAIAVRKETSIALEREAEFELDFSYADLRGMEIWSWGTDLSGTQFKRANLSDVDLVGADMSRTVLEDAILPNANLGRANLASANLAGVDISRANLVAANLCGAYFGGQHFPRGHDGAILIRPASMGAILSRAYLEEVRNLTQVQLDGARADPKKPPKLEGTVDAETGLPLVWRGKPLDDEA